MLENKLCRECSQVITGRSDKQYCDKYCANAYNNRKRREELKPLKQPLKNYERNYRVLKRLHSMHGKGKIPVDVAVAEGLLRSCPAKLLRFKGRVEEFNAFSEYAYCLLDNTKFIQIIKFK